MLRAWCRYLLLLAVCALLYIFLGGYLFLIILTGVIALPLISLFAMLISSNHLQVDFQRRTDVLKASAGGSCGSRAKGRSKRRKAGSSHYEL